MNSGIHFDKVFLWRRRCRTNYFPNCTNLKEITIIEGYDEDDVVDDDVMDSKKCEAIDSEEKGVPEKIAKIFRFKKKVIAMF